MKLQLTDTTLSLRTIRETDREILSQIYFSTRKDEIEQATQWTSDQKQNFLVFQFNAQHTYYIQNYPGANFWIIEKNRQPIGRLYLDTNFDNRSIRIIDITLLPEWRSIGIGGQLLSDIIAFAKTMNRGVSIHVESFNPAMRLYKRLGFDLVSITNGVYHLLEWKNKTTAPQTL